MLSPAMTANITVCELKIKFNKGGIMNLKFQGKGLDAKGRNGHFIPDFAEINKWPAEKSVTLSVWSRRTDGNPPIWIKLPASEMKRLGQELVKITSSPEYVVISHGGNAGKRDMVSYPDKTSLIEALKGDTCRFSYVDSIFLESNDVTEEFQDSINE